MKHFFALLTSFILFWGCETAAPEAELMLVPGQETDMTIPADGGSFNVGFTSSLDWTADIFYESGSEGWASLSHTGGKGSSDASVVVTIQKNTSSESRSAEVIITSGARSALVSFKQEGKRGLLPGPDPDIVFRLAEKSAEVPGEGGTVQVTVEYNVEYKCEVTVDWIREVESRSYDQKVHVFEVLANESENPRNTTISFCGNGTCIPFKIEQKGK